jgi:hypothetical protein
VATAVTNELVFTSSQAKSAMQLRGLEKGETKMQKDRTIKILLFAAVLLLTLNCFLKLREPTTVSAQQNPYKMLIVPVNDDGKKVFEDEVNKNGWKLHSFHLGSEGRPAVFILQK